MPFTPFHMGPALVFKAVGGRRFSLLIFGGSQVLIDLEPLIRILRGDAILHGFTHTLTGATLIGLAAGVIGRPIANHVLDWLRPDPPTKVLTWLRGDGRISWPVAVGSALIGTWSHIILDGMMHPDIRPFLPLTARNPLLGVMTPGAVYDFCVVSAVVGVALSGIVYGIAHRRVHS